MCVCVKWIQLTAFMQRISLQHAFSTRISKVCYLTITQTLSSLNRSTSVQNSARTRNGQSFSFPVSPS